MLLNNFSTALDKCLEEYEQLLSLTGELSDSFEWLFLQAKYAFYIGNNPNFESLVKKCYAELCNIETYNSRNNYLMLEELVIKYRQRYDICNFINERAAGLSNVNQILKMDADSFQSFYLEYKSTAPITSIDKKDGYYL